MSVAARRALEAAAAPVLCLASIACVVPIYRVRANQCKGTRVEGGSGEVVRVQYLGVGGFLIQHHGDVILTAPLYSNPNLIEFLMNHEIRSDTELIDRLLPPAASNARAILVGHSHYDHLMDVPYIALHKAPKARVYGSQTTAHLLASVSKGFAGGGVVALDPLAFDPRSSTATLHWVSIEGTHGRVLPILSEHSDQVTAELLGAKFPLHFGRGKVFQDRAQLPRTASEWAEGTVLAYVIEFLDEGGKVIFRIYYQDSGTNPPMGFPPALGSRPDGYRFDLAIICVGGDFRRLEGHPSALLRTVRPRYVLLAHWEDFFTTQQQARYDKVVRSIPGTPRFFLHRKSDVQVFLERMTEAQREGLTAGFWLPCPTTSSFTFPVPGENGGLLEEVGPKRICAGG